jgi:DNA-binding NarL/FixJ family response regulator
MRQIIKNLTKISEVRKRTVRIAVIDSDPLRFVGFRELLKSQSDFEIQSVSLSEIGTYEEADIVLIGSHPGRSVIEMVAAVKAIRPSLDVIVTGCNLDDTAILKAVSAGAKGYVEESASSGELVQRFESCWPDRSGLQGEFSPRSWNRHTDPRSTGFPGSSDRSQAGKNKYSGCWWRVAPTRKSLLLSGSKSAR